MTAMTGKSVGGQRDFLSDLSRQGHQGRRREEQTASGPLTSTTSRWRRRPAAPSPTPRSSRASCIDKERVHPRMAKQVKKAKIALLSAALEIKKTEVEAKIQIRDPAPDAALPRRGREHPEGMVDKIKAAGANVVFCQKGIDDLVQHYLAKAGHLRLPPPQGVRHGEDRQGHRRPTSSARSTS